MYHPPVRPELDARVLRKRLQPIPHLTLYLRLVDSRSVDFHAAFVVNPDSTRMQYKRYMAEDQEEEEEERRVEQGGASKKAIERVQSSKSQRQALPVFPQRHSPFQDIADPKGSEMYEEGAICKFQVYLGLRSISGRIRGHAHCKQSGSVFLRLSIFEEGTGLQLPFDLSDHPDPDFHKDHGGGAVPQQKLSTFWCSSMLADLGEEALRVMEGCSVKSFPHDLRSSLLLEVFQAGGGGGGVRDPVVVQEEDILVGWASLRLFKKEGQERENGQDIELNNNEHDLLLAAPPVDLKREFSKVYHGMEEEGGGRREEGGGRSLRAVAGAGEARRAGEPLRTRWPPEPSGQLLCPP
eukprot:766507-Hanusia_phi.AAC.6